MFSTVSLIEIVDNKPHTVDRNIIADISCFENKEFHCTSICHYYTNIAIWTPRQSPTLSVIHIDSSRCQFRAIQSPRNQNYIRKYCIFICIAVPKVNLRALFVVSWPIVQ